MEITFPTYRWFIILSVLRLLVPCFCETVEVWEGGSVVLPCPGRQHSPGDEVHWCKANTTDCILVFSSTSTAISIGKPWSTAGVDLVDYISLKIPFVSYSRDNGRFRCSANPRWEPYRTVRLNVLVPVKTITVTGPENPVSENKVASFTCLAKGGHPAPVFKWSVDNTSDPDLIVYKQDDHGSNVKFTATKTLNNKIIKCEASVRNKSAFGKTTINVTYKPTVSILSEKAEHSEGDSFNLNCSVDANPPADVAWSFKTKTVNNNVYRITNFDQSQTGTYVCSAENREGTGTESIVLVLKVEAREGESAVLPCPVLQHSPDDEVYWCKLDTNDCTPVLSSSSTVISIGKPWSTAGVDLVDYTSLKIPAVSYYRDNGRFRCSVYPSSEPNHTVVLNVLVSEREKGEANETFEKRLYLLLLPVVVIGFMALLGAIIHQREAPSPDPPEPEQEMDDQHDDAIQSSALPDIPTTLVNRENQVDAARESTFSEDDHYEQIGPLDDEHRDPEYWQPLTDEGYVNPYSRTVISFTKEGGPYAIIGGWAGKRSTLSMMELDSSRAEEPTTDLSHGRRTN